MFDLFSFFLFYFFLNWYSKRLHAVSLHWLPSAGAPLCSQGLQIFLLPQGFSFCCSSLLLHVCKSMPRSSLSPISSLLKKLPSPAHFSSTVEQFRYSEQFTSGEALVSVSLLLQKRAGCPQTFPKASFSPVAACGNYCLQFLIKMLEGKERDPKLSQIVIPLSGNCAGIPKELKNRQVKPGYSKV